MVVFTQATGTKFFCEKRAEWRRGFSWGIINFHDMGTKPLALSSSNLGLNYHKLHAQGG
jgi:hypothetical protein